MKVAVLGLGSIGRRHVGNLRAMGLTDLVLFDPSPPAAAAAAEAGGHVVASVAAVWKQRPAVAIIATPTASHARLAHEALVAGADVFVEKPLAASRDGLEDLVQKARSTGRATMVGCNMRFHAGPAHLKHWVQAGRIGRPLAARIETSSYLPHWRPGTDWKASYSASRSEGGAVLDCIHEFDLALWLLGPARLRHAEVQAASALGLETDGLAEVLLRHENGACTSLHVDYISRDYHRGGRIVGEQGTASWSWSGGAVLHGPDGKVVEHVPPAPDQAERMYRDEFAHFFHAIKVGEQPMNGIAEAARTLDLALQVREARP